MGESIFITVTESEMCHWGRVSLLVQKFDHF